MKFWIEELLANEPSCLLYIAGTKRDLVEDNPGARQVRRPRARAVGQAAVGAAR